MLLRRYGTFAGGIELLDEKHRTLGGPIEPYPIDGLLRVPLAPCGWGAARPLVEPGRQVRAGERIAEAPDASGIDVFAPVAGEVTAITTAEVAAEDGFVRCPAVQIAPAEWVFDIPELSEAFDWRSADGESLRRRVASGGLTTCRRPIEPLALWLERARSKLCRILVANVMENQPCVTADHRLLADRGPEVVGGLAILARAMEARQVVLAVDWRRTGDYQRIVGLARDCQISLVALPHKYPTGADPILVKVLTRRARPPGGSVTDVGVAVTDAATCQAVWRWVACGSPQVGRAVTVAGRWAPRQCNFWVPFGMPCLDLVKGAAEPAIHNGPMTGICCADGAVVTPATDAVLAVSGLAAASPTPCIRCAWCTDHCPARLNVAALNDAFELANVDQARKLVALACVECGVCTYVCPARLPLAQRVKQLKRAVGSMDRAMPSYR